MFFGLSIRCILYSDLFHRHTVWVCEAFFINIYNAMSMPCWRLTFLELCKLQCQNIKKKLKQLVKRSVSVFYGFFLRGLRTFHGVTTFGRRSGVWQLGLKKMCKSEKKQQEQQCNWGISIVSLSRLRSPTVWQEYRHLHSTCRTGFVSTVFGSVNIAVNFQLWRGEPGWYRAWVSSCSTRLFWGIDNWVVFAMRSCSASTLSLQRVCGK